MDEVVQLQPGSDRSWLRRQSLPLLCAVLFLVKQLWFIAIAGFAPGFGYLLGSLGSSLALAGLVCRLPSRLRLRAVLIAYLAIAFLLYSDLVYLRFFGTLPSSAMLGAAGQLSGMNSGTIAAYRQADLRFLLDLPLLLAGYIWLRRRSDWWQELPTSRRLAAAWGLTGLAVLALALTQDLPSLHRPYLQTEVAGRLGILPYHAYDIVATAARKVSTPDPFSPDEEAELQQWFQRHRADQQSPGELFGVARGRSLLVLQLESFQAFLIGKQVNGIEVTPNLNRLSRQTLYFPNFYAQVGDGETADADFTANCSLHALDQGVMYVRYPTNRFVCLPGLLRNQGYRTLTGNGAPAAFWNVKAVYPAVGFDRFYNLNNLKVDQVIGMGLSDASFFRQLAEVLVKEPRPFHAYLLSLTHHFPFKDPRLPADGLSFGEFEGHLTGDYLHTARYTDKVVGEFLAQMQAAGILDDALLVIYGDHGTILDRKDPHWRKLLSLGQRDTLSWQMEWRRVPLMIRWPGSTAGEYAAPTGQVDLAPTLTHLLGLPTTGAYFLGRDVFGNSTPLVTFRGGSATDGRHYYLAPDGVQKNGQCFDFTTRRLADAAECQSLSQRAQERWNLSLAINHRNLLEQVEP